LFRSKITKLMEVDRNMLWTPELIRYLEGAPWPATKQELIEYAKRIGAPPEVIQNLEENLKIQMKNITELKIFGLIIHLKMRTTISTVRKMNINSFTRPDLYLGAGFSSFN